MDKPLAEVTDTAPPPSLLTLFLSFLRLGTTSFGGGTLGWTHREVVERRRWLGEQKFMQILTVAMILPGANPVNLAVYIGVRLRGAWGALVAGLGMLAMPFLVVIAFGIGYQYVQDSAQVQSVLAGLACVGIASILITGAKSARQLDWQVLPVLIAVAIFVLVGVMRLNMIAVVAGALPVSIGLAYWLEGRRKDG